MSKTSQREQAKQDDYNREFKRGRQLGRVIWRNAQTTRLSELRRRLTLHRVSGAMYAGALAHLTEWSTRE